MSGARSQLALLRITSELKLWIKFSAVSAVSPTHQQRPSDRRTSMQGRPQLLLQRGQATIDLPDDFSTSLRSIRQQKSTVILFVDRLFDQFLIDQEGTKLVRYDFVSQRGEVAVEERI